MFLKTRIDPNQVQAYLRGQKQGRLTVASFGTIYLKQSGVVRLEVTNPALAENFKQWVEQIDFTQPLVVGSVFTGIVVRVMSFGCIITFASSHRGFIRMFEGLMHISDICEDGHISSCDIGSMAPVGSLIKVRITEIDRMGRIQLSAKAV